MPDQPTITVQLTREAKAHLWRIFNGVNGEEKPLPDDCPLCAEIFVAADLASDPIEGGPETIGADEIRHALFHDQTLNELAEARHGTSPVSKAQLMAERRVLDRVLGPLLEELFAAPPSYSDEPRYTVDGALERLKRDDAREAAWDTFEAHEGWHAPVRLGLAIESAVAVALSSPPAATPCNEPREGG